MSRREQIEEMLAEQPDDPFLNYALALECDKDGDTQQSLLLFKSLMTASSPYVPAFFMAGQLLARLDRTDEARRVLASGIKQAQEQGNQHAATEMTEFIDALPD